MKSKTADLLLAHFLRWQQELGEQKTQAEFAQYLGISANNFRHYFSGRREPGDKVVKVFAERLQDERFYDTAGIPRPDPRLHYLQRHWGTLDDETRKRISDLVATYTDEKPPKD